MNKRQFGNTGYQVSILSFGAGHIGNQGQDEAEMGRLLNLALDSGLNLIDTARSYGESEVRIGKYLSHRRKDFILSSKGGYNSTFGDWTYDTIIENVNESLKRMKTDFIEIYHLHSCPKEILERGEVTAALEKAREQGKIGIAAYSGENDVLDFAIASGRFQSIQCSVNICDQSSIDHQLKAAADREMGVIGKRPIANAQWRFDSAPVGHHHAEYWHRFQQMNMKNFGLDWNELAMRFSAYTPGVSTVITGTSSKEHLYQNIKAIEAGPLPEDIIIHLKDEFRKHDQNWTGLI